MKVVRYLRYSHDGQSQHSIQRQDIITSGWINYTKAELIDTFIDEGHTARTFDRPDMNALMSFIKKNYRKIDYLVVAELTRFSREAGDAINMVKDIQTKYGVRIVSASRSCIYDVYDSNSFFMMGLEFLLGNSENIKRQNDINGGIYAAKVSGRWIQGGKAPFGYTKEGIGKERRLVINPVDAEIIRFIFRSFLINTPFYCIEQDAKKMGMKLTHNSSIQSILQNPLYMGFQHVKAWKDKPGGLYPISGEVAIIDQQTWYRVQEKFNPAKTRVSISDRLPLKGVLNCWCGRKLTGAPSKGRSGQYFYYYKCNERKHINISANKAHDQILDIFNAISLPAHLITAIREKAAAELKSRVRDNGDILVEKKKELDTIEKSLHTIEHKFITNQIQFDTYDKWNRQLRDQRGQLTGDISRLQQDFEQTQMLLGKNLDRLSNMKLVYEKASTIQKQELIRLVFDNKLYYSNGSYRTGYIMPVFTHNALILKEKNLLYVDSDIKQIRSGGGDRTTIEHLREIIEISCKIAA